MERFQNPAPRMRWLVWSILGRNPLTLPDLLQELCFSNFRKAFDLIDHHVLTHKLTSYESPPQPTRVGQKCFAYHKQTRSAYWPELATKPGACKQTLKVHQTQCVLRVRRCCLCMKEVSWRHKLTGWGFSTIPLTKFKVSELLHQIHKKLKHITIYFFIYLLSFCIEQ